MTVDTGERVAEVRAFNRFYTSMLGLLEPEHLHTPYTLTEARVLYELAQTDRVDLRELRTAVSLDPGYLTRIVTRFESGGLIGRQRSESDGRRQVIWLTERGRAEFATLESRTNEQIAGLLSGLPEARRRELVTAMRSVRSLLDDGPGPAAEKRGAGERVVLREPRPGDMGWVVARNGALYAAEYGWDDSYEALVARIVVEYLEHRDPAYEAAWIAELAGAPVGCVFCVRGRRDEAPPVTAKLRLLLVEPTARGHGVGSRLVDECLRFAVRAGYRDMELWTQSILESARRIYRRAGFEPAATEPHHSFGHDLVAETWRRSLAPAASDPQDG